MAFRYRYLGEPDVSLQTLARRFSTDISAVFAETKKGPPPPTAAEIAIREDRHNSYLWELEVKVGQILYIPTPSDRATLPGTWKEVQAEGSTLAEMFKQIRKAQLVAAGLPDGLTFAIASSTALDAFYKRLIPTDFTAEEAWLNWRNVGLRETVLKRYAMMHPQQDMLGLPKPFPSQDIKPDEAPIQPGDKIWVPTNPPRSGMIPAAPAATSTVDVSATLIQTATTRLTQILWACRALEATRKACQTLQGKCMGELNELVALRELASIENDHGNAPLRPRAEIKAREEVVAAMDDLIQQASETMLSTAPAKVPAARGGGSLVRQSADQASYLCTLVKSKDTVKILYDALSEHGDLPFYEGISAAAASSIPAVGPKQNLVQAACAILASATYWIADTAKMDDAKSILQSALDTITTGMPPSANAKGVLDLVASLAFAPKDWPASSATEPMALCGTIDNVFMALAIGEASRAKTVAPLNVGRSKVEGTFYKILQPLLRNLGVNDALGPEDFKPFFQLLKEGKEVKSVAHEGAELIQSKLVETLAAASGSTRAANAIAQVNAARSKFGDARIKEAYGKLVAFSEPDKPFAGGLAKLGASLKPFAETYGILSDAYGVLTTVAGLASDKPDKHTVVGELKDTKSVIGLYAKGVKVLKNFGAISEEAAEEFAVYVGRVSFIFALAIAVGESIEAFEKHDYVKGTGSGIQGVAIVLFMAAPETGGVTFVIGIALFVGGTILSAHRDFSEIVTPVMKVIFEHRLDEFASGKERLGQYFPELAPALAKVKKALEEAQWDDNLVAYPERLRKAGVN